MSGYGDDYRDDGLDSRRDTDDRRFQVENARNRVRPPAIVMLVFAIISLLMVPLGVLQYGNLPQQFEKEREKIDKDQKLNAGQKQDAKDFMTKAEEIAMVAVPIFYVLHAIIGVFTVIGSLMMMNLRSYGLSVTVAVLNIISLGHNCCCLTLPVGVWALLVLMDVRVKAGFNAARMQTLDGQHRPGDEHDRYQY